MRGAITFESACAMMRAYLTDAGRRPGTIASMQGALVHLRWYLALRGVSDMREVDRPCMVGYAEYLGTAVSKRTKGVLAPDTRDHAWVAAKLLFTVLLEDGAILTHPMRHIARQRCEPTQPRVTLSEAEVMMLLDGIEVDAPCGMRDKALLELIYSSGLRAGEAAQLVRGDIDFEARLVKIRRGKFSKDRVVPMTEHAAALVKEHLAMLYGEGEARGGEELPLFPRSGGSRITYRRVNKRFRLHCERMGLYREGLSVHSLRHACATHLIAHGADLRYVQELLGHKSVETTVRYTNDEVEQVRRRYLRAHPREHEHRATVDEAYRAALGRFIERLTEARRKREVKAAWLAGCGQGTPRKRTGGHTST